jgi:tetratricopeptide (TPR) repeat protein
MSLRTTFALITAAAVVSVGVCCRTAAAANDAGTQSVFAYGVGERALAMGSAFVACADDASAMYWNVAGLGLMRRSELQLNQSANLGLGFQESNATIALPSWRWGTLGLALRHFGVDGIERRDDQNVLLGNDVSDSELEMALGYGRSLGQTWSVGGTVKLQRQSLAGFSANGLGIDLGLGVSPQWADRLRLGVGLRNVVQPSLRLDRESVPDPMTVRTGIGYRIPLGSGAGLLTELDVEKPVAASAKIHAGMEYRFFNLTALRAGLNGSVFTAGSGLLWRNLSLDYTFEDNPIATAHRVGVSLRLGPTVDERRLAARRAEDEALERRLAEAFQQRQTRQIEELLQRSTTDRVNGQFDDALEALGAVLTIDPGNSSALALQVECLKGKAVQLEHSGDFAAAGATYDLARAMAPADTAAAAGAERCRNESNRNAARTAQIRALFASAMDALAAEDFPAARDRFTQVLARDPRDTEAASMLARTEQTLARRASHLVDAANHDVRSGRLTEAQAQLDQAAKLDGHAPGLNEAVNALARAKQLAEAAPRGSHAATSPADGAARAGDAAPASTLTDREVEELYRLGLAALKAQRPDDALRYWEHVWAERPGYRGVGDFLKREYLTRGMESFGSGRLEEAIALWEKVLRVDPNDARAQGYLTRAQKQIARSREILGMGR